MTPSTILMRRVGGMLHPADEKAAALIRKIPPRTTVAVKVLRHRNPEQLALYWACLQSVVESVGRWRTPEELHLALKVATGRVDVILLTNGRRILVPQSTAFDQMTADDFSSYMDSALKILCDEVMGGISVDELLDHTGVRRAA